MHAKLAENQNPHNAQEKNSENLVTASSPMNYFQFSTPEHIFKPGKVTILIQYEAIGCTLDVTRSVSLVIILPELMQTEVKQDTQLVPFSSQRNFIRIVIDDNHIENLFRTKNLDTIC